MFAVIKVDQDYDYVSGVECVAHFDSYEKADKLVSKMRNDAMESFRSRTAYILESSDE